MYKNINIFIFYNISQYYCIYCIFDQINAALMSMSFFLQYI